MATFENIIIGAGPYGLSVAAHLRGANVSHAIECRARRNGLGRHAHELAAEFLLHAVHHVEKNSAIEVQSATAQPPVRAQQEMISEDAMLRIVESAPGDERKVGEVLFILASPVVMRLDSGNDFQPALADMGILSYTLTKTRITSSEDFPQHTVARLQTIIAAVP